MDVANFGLRCCFHRLGILITPCWGRSQVVVKMTEGRSQAVVKIKAQQSGGEGGGGEGGGRMGVVSRGPRAAFLAAGNGAAALEDRAALLR